MTTTETGLPPCPQCGKADSIDLDDGKRLCLICRNEWNPATAVYHEGFAPLPILVPTDERGDILEILHAPTAEDVLGPPTVPWSTQDQLQAYIETTGDVTADWTEKWVRTAGGDVLLVLEDMGDGMFYGADVGGDEYQLQKADVTYLGDEPIGPGETVAESPTGEDEPVYPAILAVAGLALTVGLEAVSEDPEEGFTHARIGWLPPPANQIPEVEQGVAYAIAALIRIFGIDRAEVEKLAANLLTGAEGGTETEGQ